MRTHTTINPVSCHSSTWQNAWAKLPHALIYDVSLSVDARALLIYRLARSPSWALHWKDTGRRFGWSKSRCYGAITELTKKGYLERRQGRPRGGRWGRAEETINLAGLPTNGRPGFQLLPRTIVDDERLNAMGLVALALMRSHAATRAFYARDLARALGSHQQTAHKILGQLIELNYAVKRRQRSVKGKFAGCVYRLTEQGNKKVGKWTGAKTRETVLRDSAKKDTYQISLSTKDQPNEGRKRTTYALQGQSGEGRNVSLDWSWRESINSNLQGYFEEVSEEEVDNTVDAISHTELLQQVLAAAQGRLHRRLFTPEGLSPVRIFLAAGATLDEVLDIIARRIGQKKGKFINGWGVIAAAVASDILRWK